VEARKEKVIARLAAALVLGLAAGAHAQEPTTVGLQAQAAREFPNNQVVANVFAEESGRDAAALAGAVNRKMAAALAAARAFPSVRARSGNYQTYPLYKDGKIESWRVSQQLRLESGDFAAMAQLLGQLQRDLVVRGMSVGLSDEARRDAENALIAEALTAFEARGTLVRQAMKAGGHRVKHIDVNTSSGRVTPYLEMARQASVSASAPPPAIEAGSSQVTVNVSGTIELR
jgi:predicted secreted protein